MLIFMVLQLAGSAGTYPIEISGKLANDIHDFVPFTYSVNAFRSAIAGGESIAQELTVLAVLAIIFTVLTIVVFAVRSRRIKQNKPTLMHWIEAHGLA
jgi:putative membrane protein